MFLLFLPPVPLLSSSFHPRSFAYCTKDTPASCPSFKQSKHRPRAVLSNATRPALPKFFAWLDEDPGPPESVHNNASYTARFVNHDEVLEPESFQFLGSVPSYLHGRVAYRVGLGRGTAMHSDGVQWKAPHIFEYLSMVTSLTFDCSSESSSVTVLQRLNCKHVLDTIQSTSSKDYVSINFSTTRRSFYKMLTSWRIPTLNKRSMKPLFNFGVTCERIPGWGLVARSDVAVVQKLDPRTLEQGPEMWFGDLSPELNGVSLAPSHGVMDKATEKYFNVAWDFPILGHDATYRVFSVNLNSQMEVIASFKAPATYMHCIAATKKHIIVMLPAVQISGPKFLLSLSIGDALERKRPARIVVVSRNGGGVVNEYETQDDVSLMHVANAWDDAEQDEVVVQGVSSPSLEEVAKMPVSIADPNATGTMPWRSLFHMRLQKVSQRNRTSVVRRDEVSGVTGELPRINDKYQFKENRYVYSVHSTYGLLNSCIRKVDTKTSSGNRSFAMPNCMFDEPLFIGSPNSAVEDDGVLVVLGFNTNRRKTFVAIIDAMSFQLRAVAKLEGVTVPPAFHWYLHS